MASPQSLGDRGQERPGEGWVEEGHLLEREEAREPIAVMGGGAPPG